MKPFLILLAVLSSAIVSNAQNWAPIGAKWTYGVGWAFHPVIEYREWIATGDTMIGGHNCRVIQKYGMAVVGDLSDKLITYEDSNVIYWYNMNQFTVLYDFNKTVGESWTTMFDTCSLLVTVQATGIDTINGVPLKYLYVSSSNAAFNGKIVERIGHLWQPSPDVTFHCYHIYSDMNFYNGLRCYEDSLIGYKNFGITEDCNFSTLNLEQIENPFELLIFPNPASNQLNIQTNKNQMLNYKIYNSVGQIVQSDILQNNVATVDIKGLKRGFYILELASDKSMVRKSFVVKL